MKSAPALGINATALEENAAALLINAPAFLFYAVRELAEIPEKSWFSLKMLKKRRF